MDYNAMYQQKLTSAAEAVKVVKSGDWVDYGWCINHPVALDKALASRQDELYDVKVRGGGADHLVRGGKPTHVTIAIKQREQRSNSAIAKFYQLAVAAEHAGQRALP